MDYKEKYEDALEWAKAIYPNMSEEDKEDMEVVFPELKESRDERIRKALIKFHKSTIDIDGIKGSDVIDWLERQGCKKDDKIEQNTEESFWSEDERIKKGIISNLKYLLDKSEGFVKDELKERIAWLENNNPYKIKVIKVTQT